MPLSRINGVELYRETHGDSGDPMVLVHGSWGDHNNWATVVPALARTFRVVTYDRRGHSLSERPAGQGSIHEDVADLTALVETLGAPAHIVGNSGGAAVTLGLAGRRPDLFRTMIVHEPPLFALLEGDPAAAPILAAIDERIAAVVRLLEVGDDAAGAELFVETIAFGPGAWAQFPPQMQATFIHNAPTFLDEMRDPDNLRLDLDALRRFDRPALLTTGEVSPPFFPKVMDRIAGALPHAVRRIFPAAGHVPHVTNPDDYVRMVRGFIAAEITA